MCATEAKLDELFFEAAAYQPRGSLPIRNAADLKTVLAGMHVWIIGTSKEVRIKLDALLRLAGHDKKMTTLLSIPFHEKKSVALAKSLQHICDSGPKNIIFIADEDYGPALGELCSLMPKAHSIPTLLPNGYIAASIKSGSFSFGYTNITRFSLHDMCTFIHNKKIFILSENEEECKKIS